MSIAELFFIAVGLSMDAFAVAVCKGLTNHNINSNSKLKKSIIIALYFGTFQALMPFIGYLLGSRFSDKIESVDHWIAFVLLLIIGGKMIWESFASKSDSECDDDITFKKMLPLAIATSIDALAVGITFAFLQVNIVPAITFIGIITFILSLIGVEIGKLLGHKFCSKAEFAGGAILILIGTKTLFEHLGIINF